ncbi:MAG: glycosyltransferase family 2 protein [Deltaproteobacteria bacterium]|nr:glycosyltransferase family 2 protein [Deltaproteobacteria bacterium]
MSPAPDRQIGKEEVSVSRISVVIPAYNEEEAIASTVTEIREILDGGGLADSEILVVDDGSADRTADLAEGAGARVLRNPHNVGYGSALKRGIKAATHDTICITDADMTYPVDRIPDLVYEYEQGFDMVVGMRTGHHYRGSMFKGPLRTLLRMLVEFAAGRKVPDANSGLRVFSKETVSQHLNHLCDTFSFTTSMTLAYMMTSRFVRHIPIDYHERVGSTKVRLLSDSLRTLQYITQSIMYYNPMKIFVLFSLVCVIGASLSFLAGALLGIRAPYFLGLGGLVVALFMFGLGLMADLLRQILIK